MNLGKILVRNKPKQADIPAAHWVILWEERLYIDIPISPVIITHKKRINKIAYIWIKINRSRKLQCPQMW